jgi:hypothetical protein
MEGSMRSRANYGFYTVSSACYLTLLWFVSGLVRKGGLAVVAAGVVAWLACLISVRFGRRRPLFLLLLNLLLVATTVAGIEAVLRLAPRVARGTIANHAFGGYHSLPGGMYVPDEYLGYDMKPGVSRDISWNGFWWRHETNADGYRGPIPDPGGAVFLGDSMIYGHGLDNEFTVPSRFSALTGNGSANLGQQGTCLIQMSERFRRTGVKCRPSVVYVCSHYNDIHEATIWYPRDELTRFVTEQDYTPRALPAYRPRRGWRPDLYWDAHLAPALHAAGALCGLKQMILRGAPAPSQGIGRSTEVAFVPSAEFIDMPLDALAPPDAGDRALGWSAHRRAIGRILGLCREQGAELVMFDLGYPASFAEAIESMAREIGARYSPAGRVALQKALDGEDIFLPNDGHWTAHGCDVIARELADCSTTQHESHPR